MNAIPVDRTTRLPRVPFAQPVRVVPLGGPPRAFRVLAGNLSRGGIFLNSKEPFEEGTKVALSLEAQGRVLPFAQGEVVWKRYGDGTPAPGFGVKFTGFLHPRAHDMVGYLVKAIETGEPLKFGQAKGHSWKQLGAAGAAALIAGAVITAGFLAVVSGTSEPIDDEPLAAAAPIVAPAPAPAPAPEPAAAPAAAAPAPAPALAPRRTIPLAPMVLDGAPGSEAPEPEPESLAALEQPPAPAPVVRAASDKALELPSGPVTRLTWNRSGEALSFTLTLKPGARVQKAFLLDHPPRLAVDVSGAAPQKSHVLEGPDAALFHRVRVGRTGSAATRLVVDLARSGKKVQEQGASIVVSH